MKADITRRSFDPLRHFSRVLMQQGRVQLDADWNEQAAILLHLQRQLARDLALATGTVFGTGFAVTSLAIPGPVSGDVAMAPGTFYVDGILCELAATPAAVIAWNGTVITVGEWTLDEIQYQKGQYVQLWDAADPNTAAIDASITAVDYTAMTLTLNRDVSALSNAKQGRVRRVVTYLTQPDFPKPPALAGGGEYQFYLDVWERLITSLEDLSILEPALNGPDTAARARVVWQVKALSLAAPTEVCMTSQQLDDQLQPINRGLLRARTQPSPAASDPCTISPDSQYRGPENQLYRVEIHTGSNDPTGRPASFKWSRENGSVVFPIVRPVAVSGGSATVTLGNLGRDDRFGLQEGDSVELQDDASVLADPQVPGTLLQVQSIDRANLVVVLQGTTTAGIGTDLSLHPLLRRWDHKPGPGIALGADNAIPIRSAGLVQRTGKPLLSLLPLWIDLEDGVQVQFADTHQPQYRTGDYWLIPARVATGNVIWPTETATDDQGATVTNPVARRPDGVEHHYAPLAIVSVDKDAEASPGVRPCFSARA